MTARVLRGLVVAATSTILAGCGANFNSVFRTSEGNRNHINYTDAKQSATIVQVDKDGVMRTCAAKSPDVFSALATAASGALDFAQGAMKLGASAAGSSAEQAASIGLRTQLTQSQAELLYQLCLQALNGKLSNEQLVTELHRYQNTMVTMLAIEQLTGYARPTVVTLQTGATTGATKELLELSKRVDAARDDEKKASSTLDAAKAETEKKQQASDKAKADVGAKKKDQEVALKPLSDAAAKAKQELDAARVGNSPDLDAKQKAYDKATKDVEDKKKEQETALKPLADAVTVAADGLKAAQAAEKKAQTALADATKIRTEREDVLQRAKGNPDTAAAGSGSQVTSPAGNFYITDNAAASAEIARVVGDIQRTHLWQSFATDDCLRFLLQSASSSESRAVGWTGDERDKLFTLCQEQVKRSADWRFQNLYLSYGCDAKGENCRGPAQAPNGSSGPVTPFVVPAPPPVR